MFCADISFAPMVVVALQRCTRKPLNVHLMIVEPEPYLDPFALAGTDRLLVQAEPSSTIHLHHVFLRIREFGKKPGVVLDPASPTELVEYVLHLDDIVLVMTVNPIIEVDAGENAGTAAQAIEAGANSIVARSVIFGSRDYAAAIAAIRNHPADGRVLSR